MSVICQCSSCKARYQLGDQYAGRKIKCPKCSAVVDVPVTSLPRAVGEGGTAGDSPSFVDTKVGTAPPPRRGAAVSAVKPLPAEPVGDQEHAAVQGGDDNFGFLHDEAATRKRTARTAARGPSQHEASAFGGNAPAPLAGNALRPKKQKKSMAGWTVAAIIGSLAVVAIVIGGTYMVLHKPEDSVAASARNSSKVETEPKGPQVTFTFNWPESERNGATLTINGDLRAIPPTGDIKIPLPKVSRPYHFVLERRGFVKKEFSRPVTEDDDYTVTQWESVNRGIDWEQDFAAAKKAAADQHKNVFIVFDASDAKNSAFHSSRLHDSVLARSEFAERVKNEYVCVYIDNPEKEEAKKKVRDLKQNREVTGKFEIRVFPTVVVTDPRGRPFGVMEDYTINGVNAFLPLMDKWQHDRELLFEYLNKSEHSSDTELIGNTLDFLELNNLDQFYSATVDALTRKLPSGRTREVSLQEAEFWRLKFAMAFQSPDNAKKAVGDFDRWKSKHSFAKHPDAGAELNAFAAMILLNIREKDAAKKEYDDAMALHPKSSRVHYLLAEIQEALTGKPGERVPLPQGSGSGFCIAEGNHILTNHHVIRGAAKIMVHLNGEDEKYPAQLVADDPDGDMAVLKIELPEGKNLKPIPLAANDVNIGDEICAFGWPGLLSDNPTSTLTKGVVSTKHKDDGYLVMDCKVEHGNSGGPLCSVSGCCIAGMVTAKTATVGNLNESYGLAIPASQLTKFLGEKLPADTRRKIPPPSNTAGAKLSDVVKAVQGSVVYVENYQ